jgi:hypothetical protein
MAFDDGTSGQARVPVRLVLQQPASAHAEDGSVVLTLIVFDPAQPEFLQEIEVAMDGRDADNAIVKMRRAIDDAARNLRS